MPLVGRIFIDEQMAAAMIDRRARHGYLLPTGGPWPSCRTQNGNPFLYENVPILPVGNLWRQQWRRLS